MFACIIIGNGPFGLRFKRAAWWSLCLFDRAETSSHRNTTGWIRTRLQFQQQIFLSQLLSWVIFENLFEEHSTSSLHLPLWRLHIAPYTFQGEYYKRPLWITFRVFIVWPCIILKLSVSCWNIQYHTNHLAWYRVIQIECSVSCCFILKHNLDLLVRKCTTLNVLIWYWMFEYDTECFSMIQGHTIKTLIVWAWYSMILNNKCITQGHAYSDWSRSAWYWKFVYNNTKKHTPMLMWLE